MNYKPRTIARISQAVALCELPQRIHANPQVSFWLDPENIRTC